MITSSTTRFVVFKIWTCFSARSQASFLKRIILVRYRADKMQIMICSSARADDIFAQESPLITSQSPSQSPHSKYEQVVTYFSPARACAVHGFRGGKGSKREDQVHPQNAHDSPGCLSIPALVKESISSHSSTDLDAEPLSITVFTL